MPISKPIPIENRSFLRECTREVTKDLLNKAERFKLYISLALIMLSTVIFGISPKSPILMFQVIMWDLASVLIAAIVIFPICLFFAAKNLTYAARADANDLRNIITDLNKTISASIRLIFLGTMSTVDHDQNRLGFVINAKNLSQSTLHECQVQTWIPQAGDFVQAIWVNASAPFSLHPDSDRSCCILTGSLSDPSEHLHQLEFLESDGKWVSENLNIMRLVPAGNHTVYVRIIARDTVPSMIEVQLTHNRRWDAHASANS